MTGTSGAELLADLERRNLLHDTTDREALTERLDAGPVSLYCGFDPTADSLHVGNLQSLMLLRRFQLAGHRPIALAGGATGMIGDPSGRSDERNLLDMDTLDANVAAIKEQLRRFLDFSEGPTRARLVDNRDWTAAVSVLEFLRDVGKHITVNTMLAKDSVKSRITREAGISFTEFSYMLLQANDFHVLHEREGCELQVAGSDQWGNIVAGIDLVRRRTGHSVHGLTAPLIVRADGQKFGKSVDGAIFLAPHRTSPYRFFQYFMGVADGDVGPLLARLTLLPMDEVDAVVADHMEAPDRRRGQRRLAEELTSLVHGPDQLAAVVAATEVVFGGRPITDASPEALEALVDELPTTRVPRSELEGGSDLLALLVEAGVAKSKGEVRKNSGGFYVNRQAVGDRQQIDTGDLLFGRFALLSKGKRQHHLVLVTPS